MQQIQDRKKEFHIVNDKLGTPTYTHDFAANVKLLIENGQRGLFNMVCGGLTSRLEVATELVKMLDLQEKIKILITNLKLKLLKLCGILFIQIKKQTCMSLI